MQFAKRSLLAIAALIIAATLVAKNQVTAANQPAKTLLSQLPGSIVQHLKPVDSAFGKSEAGQKAPPPDKVIRIAPPRQYLDWFRKTTDCTELDNLELEAMPYPDTVLVLQQGGGEVTITIDGKTTGSNLVVLQSENIPPDVSREVCSVSGIIQIDVLPDHRFSFPFKCEIEMSKEKSVKGIRTPTRATITWQRPEAWKKDE
jgi:hypothetical protein